MVRKVIIDTGPVSQSPLYAVTTSADGEGDR
jgi:hypothetical protein